MSTVQIVYIYSTNISTVQIDLQYTLYISTVQIARDYFSDGISVFVKLKLS